MKMNADIAATLASVDTRNALYTQVHPNTVQSTVRGLERKGVRLEKIGNSRSGRWPLWGLSCGDQDSPVIALTGNNHAEEVVGTLTILYFFEQLVSNADFAWLLKRFRFVAAPQMNPDGVVNNWDWIHDPTTLTYLHYKWRDHRGEDVEHGIAETDDTFVRPEPKALRDFYAREAAGRTIFYCSFHSCSKAAGAYFLTVNEDVGNMRDGFDFIQAHGQQIGLPFRTENTNGFKGFRRIRDGVYSVPRFQEMKASHIKDGKTGKGFGLNSVEWMLQHGTTNSFVSEVPMMIPLCFTENVIDGTVASQFLEPLAPLIQKHLDHIQEALTYFAGRGSQYVAHPDRLLWQQVRFKDWTSKAAESLTGSLKFFVDMPGLEIHRAMLDAQEPYARFKLASFYLSIVDQRFPEFDMYVEMMHKAYNDLCGKVGLSQQLTSLEAHMRFQLLLIFAGILNSYSE